MAASSLGDTHVPGMEKPLAVTNDNMTSYGIKFSSFQKIALYIFFFSINFEVWDPLNTGGYFSISKLTGFIYLLTIIPQFAYFVRVKTLEHFLLPIWVFFWLLTVMSFLNITDQFNNFFDFSIFQNIFLFWFLSNHEQEEPLVLEKGFLIFALGSTALALLFLAGIGVGDAGDGRAMIFGDNSNIIGVKMSISMIVLALAVMQNRLNLGKLRYLFLAFIPILLQLMLATASRVAFISLVVALTAGVILYKAKKAWHKIAVIGMGVIIFIILLNQLLKSEILLLRLLQSSQGGGNLANRNVVWQDIIPIIQKYPFFGIGETGYAEFTQPLFSRVISPHNVFLEVLCYTGAIGLIIYLIFFQQLIKKAYKDYKVDGLLLPLLFLIPVLGILLSGQILNVKIGWCIFAYIAGSSRFKTGTI
jgi:O-antigen ligase